jgi:hypothetical protein
MIELIKYFSILFMSPKISRERLKDFTESHIARLTANNPAGVFTTILTNITTAYNSYFGDLSSESVNLAVQEGKTIAMNESRIALEKNITENEKLIAYTYRNNAPFYEEFYPLGLTEYQNADLPTLETISNRYLTVLTNHAADFPATFLGAYALVQNTFVANRAAQTTAKGNVDAERSDLATTRPALALQLTTNLLTIALHYVGDESKSDVYFDQSILNAAFKESERKITANIDAGGTQNVFDNIIKSDLKLQCTNTGETPLFIGFKTTADEACTATDFVINPGESVQKTASELGFSSTKKFLNITNPGSTTGSYIIEKVS